MYQKGNTGKVYIPEPIESIKLVQKIMLNRASVYSDLNWNNHFLIASIEIGISCRNIQKAYDIKIIYLAKKKHTH